MKVKYIGPFEEIELVGHPENVKKNDEIEVSDDLGKSLLTQVGNFEPADAEAEKVLKAIEAEAAKAEAVDNSKESRSATEQALIALGLSSRSTVSQLKAYAAEHDVDLKGATNKNDLIAAITSPDNTKES